MPLEEIAG